MQPDPQPTRPNLLRVLVAPWVGVVAPRRAAATLAAASLWLVLPAFALVALVGAGVFLGAVLWGSAFEWVELGDPNSPMGSRYAPQPIPVAQVWEDMHASGPVSPAELIGIGVFCGFHALMLVAAWLFWPMVHVSGSVVDSLRRSVAAAAAGCGMFCLLLAGAAWFTSWHVRVANLSSGSSLEKYLFPLQFTIVLLVPLSMIVWLGRTSRAARGDPPAAPPPRCEGCGYDLTHQPESGRCSECGYSVARSLTEGEHRPGVPWQSRDAGALAAWFSTLIELLARPRAFYSRLRVRDREDDARRFARMNFVLLALCFPPWLLFVMVSPGSELRDPDVLRNWFMGVIPGTLGVLLAAWCAHRSASALAGSGWMLRGLLLDGRWGAQVIAYESGTAWVFALYNGLLVGSFVFAQTWISDLVFDNARTAIRAFGMPLEPLAVLGGSLLIYGWTIYRFRIAIHAVRWNNF